MGARHFTISEAEGLLPRLTRLLQQIRPLKAKHDLNRSRIAELAGKIQSNGHGLEDTVRQTRQDAEQTAAELNALLVEVHELGCEVKDVDQGLIDFRALRDGREVYLCWKLGEEQISWWHDLDTGFAGRQPLPRDSDTDAP
ncbi:MAG: DUF2203 domain-containing protein [Gammaproteobacteria bacterium]